MHGRNHVSTSKAAYTKKQHCQPTYPVASLFRCRCIISHSRRRPTSKPSRGHVRRSGRAVTVLSVAVMGTMHVKVLLDVATDIDSCSSAAQSQCFQLLRVRRAAHSMVRVLGSVSWQRFTHFPVGDALVVPYCANSWGAAASLTVPGPKLSPTFAKLQAYSPWSMRRLVQKFIMSDAKLQTTRAQKMKARTPACATAVFQEEGSKIWCVLLVRLFAFLLSITTQRCTQSLFED